MDKDETLKSASRFIAMDDSARRALERGASILADAVKVTLGPKNRNVVLDKFGKATIAKEIELPDVFENMGAQLVKEVASKTNDIVGDGTTTATVLAQAIIREGLRNVTAGSNPLLIKRGIEKAVEAAVAEMQKLVQTVDTAEKIAQVASISANDKEIGGLISQAMNAVGKDGVITVEESKSMKTDVEIKGGMLFDKGYISPYMVTDSERMQAELIDPYILVTERKISAIADILPLLEKIVQVQKPLLIIAEDVEGEALATLVVNKLRGTFTTVAVKAPGFGDRRKEMLKDIATLTGATVISDELGLDRNNFSPDLLGQAKTVKVTKEETTIVDGRGAEDAIKGRIEMIKRQIDETDSNFQREKLQERLAKLSGGVAVIQVGAATETELKEKKQRIEDALLATRAAVQEGMIPGGGSSLVHALKGLGAIQVATPDEKIGVDIIRRALEEPLRQIAENAGFEGSVEVNRVKKSRPGQGLNVMTGDLVDMIAAGIVEPFKVTRSALQNAASIGALVLTTETLIADKPESDPYRNYDWGSAARPIEEDSDLEKTQDDQISEMGSAKSERLEEPLERGKAQPERLISEVLGRPQDLEEPSVLLSGIPLLPRIFASHPIAGASLIGALAAVAVVMVINAAAGGALTNPAMVIVLGTVAALLGLLSYMSWNAATDPGISVRDVQSEENAQERSMPTRLTLSTDDLRQLLLDAYRDGQYASSENAAADPTLGRSDPAEFDELTTTGRAPIA